ncbi:MAG: ubiquinone biosynthesis regulatory protein kinase UbiB, partial [Gammaproteobacteria bacterium]
MNRVQLLLRLLSIQQVLIRHGVDELLTESRPLGPARWLFRLSPASWFPRRHPEPRAVRIRQALEDLGPIFVKFGQSVSTRQDLLPPDIGQELTK